jgi:two-component sensor histidine kinase
MLTEPPAHMADLTDVIRNEISLYSGRVAIEGPRLLLAANAVHELATNAAKYGALSNKV